DPAQARFVAKVKWLMLLSGFATFLGIAVVLGVIGYRVFKDDGRAMADVTALLPKGAKVVSTSIADDRIAVIVEVNGVLEIRTFDLKSFRPLGRMRFATEP